MNSHKCKNGKDWLECIDCGGRIHLPECTTRKVKGKDCDSKCYK